MIKNALVIISCITLFSCSATNISQYRDHSWDGIFIAVQDPLNYQLEKGDYVKITTQDLVEYEFEITEVTSSALLGKYHNVLIKDISILEVKAGVVESGVYFTTVVIFRTFITLLGAGLLLAIII